MSVVPVYVRAINGMLYSNPLIVCPDRTWYIVFSDHDHPEFILDKNIIAGRRSAIRFAKKILANFGLKFDVLKDAKETYRIFPVTTKYHGHSPTLQAAYAVRFILRSAIPVPESFGESLLTPPEEPCLVIDYSQPSPVESGPIALE